MRELMKALYRDLYRYPVIAKIRRSNNDTTDCIVIDRLFEEELNHTHFIGVGNPSESGCHLLYYFRQRKMLCRRGSLSTPTRYLNDSGRQARSP